ncbi:MAG: single-stranded DNA-binding protein [Spirochaetales bacterium]|nr:single-stranded DNA-binding protein [Spirochaetales bacterium]
MNQLNSVLLEGNLVRDPESTVTPSGAPVCHFSIASDRFYKKNDDFEKEVSFFDIQVWNNLAETCAGYLKKGRGVRIVGRLKQDRWTDSRGKSKFRVYVVAEHVEFKPQYQPGKAHVTA